MSKFNKESQKSVRVVLPLTLYNDIKDRCTEHGDMSRVVRYLLKQWIRSKGTVRQAYDVEAVEAVEDEAPEALDDNIE